MSISGRFYLLGMVGTTTCNVLTPDFNPHVNTNYFQRIGHSTQPSSVLRLKDLCLRSDTLEKIGQQNMTRFYLWSNYFLQNTKSKGILITTASRAKVNNSKVNNETRIVPVLPPCGCYISRPLSGFHRLLTQWHAERARVFNLNKLNLNHKMLKLN